MRCCGLCKTNGPPSPEIFANISGFRPGSSGTKPVPVVPPPTKFANFVGLSVWTGRAHCRWSGSRLVRTGCRINRILLPCQGQIPGWFSGPGLRQPVLCERLSLPIRQTRQDPGRRIGLRVWRRTCARPSRAFTGEPRAPVHGAVSVRLCTGQTTFRESATNGQTFPNIGEWPGTLCQISPDLSASCSGGTGAWNSACERGGFHGQRAGNTPICPLPAVFRRVS